jgi:ubiquitin carboxyl-terminal hydrolase L3
MENENWKALESNPVVMNKFLDDLGFNTKEFSITDLFALEDWAIGMIPQPAIGLILLFPCTGQHKQYKKTQNEAIEVRTICYF